MTNFDILHLKEKLSFSIILFSQTLNEYILKCIFSNLIISKFNANTDFLHNKSIVDLFLLHFIAEAIYPSKYDENFIIFLIDIVNHMRNNDGAKLEYEIIIEYD